MSLRKPVKSRVFPKRTGVNPVTYTRRASRGARKRNPNTLVPNFRSDFERNFWEKHKAKVPLEYEPFHILGERVQKIRYLPDFVVKDTPHSPVVFETKGWWRPTDRTRLKYILASNPALTVVMVFQADNTLTKKSKTRYSAYCRKNRIPFVIGTDLSKIVWPEDYPIPRIKGVNSQT